MSATIDCRVARDTGSRRFGGAPVPRARRRMPLPPLIAIGGFALVGLLALLPSRRDDGAKPIAEKTVLAVASPDETLRVQDVRDGALLGLFPGDKDSFVRGVFHSLDTYRKVHRIGPMTPYRLAEMSDGRVLLTDPGTSTTIDLEGFGSVNASKFTAMLGLAPLKGPE